MKKTVRAFELNEKVERFTQPKDLTRLKIVVQNTREVKYTFTGLEPMAFIYLWNNMKQNEFALVFNEETNEMYGYISKNEIGIPQRYLEPEALTFSDMYQPA